MAEIDLLEAPQQGLSAPVERLEIGVFDAILAVHLLDDQFGIEPDGQPPDAAIGGSLETEHQRRPLGQVVGGDPEIGADFLDDLARGIEQHRAAGGGTRIAARAAVGEERGVGRYVVEEHPHDSAPFGGREAWTARPVGKERAMKRFLHSAAVVTALFATVVATTSSAALAASTFYGIVIHVSTNNIKVQDSRTKQTLSFTLVPKFDEVFSANGKTTYQMSKVKAGQYVGIIYDQKALGIRHADKIYLLNNANEKIGTQ